jgi:site-specific DNA recombinase
VKKQKKCYIYTRVSTAIQVDGYSLDAQKDKLRKYAEYQDMTIVSEFSDEGFSGKNIKGRPEFTRMMEKIETARMAWISFWCSNSPVSGVMLLMC